MLLQKFVTALGIALFFHGQAFAGINTEEVLMLSRQFEEKAYDYTVQNGADIKPTRDGRSFTVWWQPEDFDPARDTVLVILHGHQGWATKGFEVWHPRIQSRRYATLGIQWWYGRSAEPAGYAKPHDIYRWIDEALDERGIPPGHVILEAFSMGGANSYAVAYLDRRRAHPYFGVIISNAGAMEEDYPPNRAFLDLPDGSRPFAGARWILYCAEKDEQRPESCQKMEWTSERLKALGAKVEKFIRDPAGMHGGFMKPENLEPSLDLADGIISKHLS